MRNLFVLMLAALILTGLSSCKKEKEIPTDYTINNTFPGTAVNKANLDCATFANAIELSYSTSASSTPQYLVKIDNELIVSPGDEIEVAFGYTPSVPDATFNFPDKQVVNLASGSTTYTWKVPENIQDGDSIVSEARVSYAPVTLKGKIKLVKAVK